MFEKNIKENVREPIGQEIASCSYVLVCGVCASLVFVPLGIVKVLNVGWDVVIIVKPKSESKPKLDSL